MIMDQKKSPLKALPPDRQATFLKGFFTSGGTPPAHEQSARADVMAYLLGEEHLPTKKLRYHFRRHLKREG